jgi:hypothetical protein
MSQIVSQTLFFSLLKSDGAQGTAACSLIAQAISNIFFNNHWLLCNYGIASRVPTSVPVALSRLRL